MKKTIEDLTYVFTTGNLHVKGPEYLKDIVELKIEISVQRSLQDLTIRSNQKDLVLFFKRG